MLAGTNGAGKSSIGGARLEAEHTPFYNPDTETRVLMTANPAMTSEDANAAAWRIGKGRLEAAIDERTSFNFETTLGGRTIARLLVKAHEAGLRVRVWHCGLNSVELHIARVRARVRYGGHDIPEARIRERYDASRNNLCAILPSLDELMLCDNSAAADPHQGQAAQPVQLLRYRDGTIVYRAPVMPDWAKPIAAVALQQVR
ncbi:MAG: zeta toxin family protein [Steroidobacteraceae bacterium]